MPKLLAQGKKISQIIAYIWANDNETSQQLDKYFKVPASSTNPLSSLLFAQEGEEPQYGLLKEVFKKYPDALPIFDKLETRLYNFQVTYNRFEGALTDPTPGEDTVTTMIIPYPPRPQIYDNLNPPTSTDPLAKNAPLKASELQEWLNENPNIPPYYYQENPYIPTTCC